MPVTLEEIAKAAGVSRGTVDRALHDRVWAALYKYAKSKK